MHRRHDVELNDPTAGSSRKVARLGIQREPGYLYFLHWSEARCDVTRVLMKRAGQPSQPPEVIAGVDLRREEGYLYFFDAEGDISRVSTVLPKPAEPKEDPHPEHLDLPHRDDITGRPHCLHPLPDEPGKSVCCWCADVYLTERDGPGEHGPYAPAAQQAPAAGATGLPDDLRSKGWAVAVHNDYRLAGVPHTFWLLTKGDRCVKGEGLTDAEALNQIRAHLAPEAAQQAPAVQAQISPGAIAIAEERARQMAKEGWTPERDDEHADGSLAQAAACYAWPPDDKGPGARHVLRMVQVGPPDEGPDFWYTTPAWPWDTSWDKRGKHDRRRRLVIAGALIAAEIDRLDRCGRTAPALRLATETIVAEIDRPKQVAKSCRCGAEGALCSNNNCDSCCANICSSHGWGT